MAKILRVSQKTFGLGGPIGDFGQFGSLAANAKVTSQDPAVIQQLQAWLNGWGSAVVPVGSEPSVPALEDMNGLFLVAFYQLAYLLQAGIAEWIAGTTYYKNSFVQVNGTIYLSLTDNNVNNNPTTDVVNWVSAPNSAPVGSLYGGVPSNNSIDPTFRIDFTACQSKDDTGLYIMKAQALTKNITANWAAGNGQGGLDTGTIGSSPVLVYFFQIGDKFGIQPSDFLFSKSLSSPMLPPNYNLKRCVGHRYWTGTQWVQFFTIGKGIQREIFLLNSQLLTNVYGGWLDCNVSAFANPNLCRKISGGHFTAGGTETAALQIRPKGSTDTSSATYVNLDQQAGGNIVTSVGRFTICLDSNGIFQYLSTQSGSSLQSQLSLYLTSYVEGLVMEIERELVPITIDQKATFILPIYATRKIGNKYVPVDLSGCSAKMDIKGSPSADDILITLSTMNGRINIQGSGGTITLTIKSDDTKDLPAPFEGVYDLLVTSPIGIVTRLLQGTIIITPGVTT